MFIALYDKIAFRIALDALFFVVVVFMPWWISMLMLVPLLFYFRVYYEAFVAGFVLDALFAVPIEPLNQFMFFYTALFGLLFFVALYSKDHLRVEY